MDLMGIYKSTSKTNSETSLDNCLYFGDHLLQTEYGAVGSDEGNGSQQHIPVGYNGD
jgi:hypothetical protein